MHGPDKVSRLLVGLLERYGGGMLDGSPVLVNGEPGFVAWGAKGKVLGVVACTVVDGRIVEILSVSDRERLASMGLPARPE